MKRIFVVGWLCVFSFHTAAQLSIKADTIASRRAPFSESHGYFGFSGTSFKGGAMMGTGFEPNGWGFSSQIHWLRMSARNLPSDYRGGSSLLLPFGGGGTPADRVFMFSCRGVKQFSLGTPFLRWGIEAGPSFVQLKALENFQPIPAGSGLFGSSANYTYDTVSYTTLGLSVRTQIVLALTRFWGVEVGVLGNWNKHRSWVAFEVACDLGHVREKLKKSDRF